MDWFKENPFLGGLAVAAAVILLAGGYLVFSASSRLSEEQTAFEDKSGQFERLQRNKPFPNQANVQAAEQEKKQVEELLAGIAKSFEVTAPPGKPQEFQDELNKLVKDIIHLAEEKNVALPDGFYLGFETYETQPPSAEAATELGLQLRSIHAVVKVLVESQVNSVGPILRDKLRVEGGASAKESEENPKKKKDKESAHAFGMAAFDVNFTAGQTAFRTAFNRILGLKPPIFIRLAAITNSAPAAPQKGAPPVAEQPAPVAAAQDEAAPAEVKPVFGHETLTVDLRLASITAGANSP